MLSKEQVQLAVNVANALDALSEEFYRLNQIGRQDQQDELTDIIVKIAKHGARSEE